MNETQKQDILHAIEENRARMIAVLNSEMDRLRDRVLSGDEIIMSSGTIYPLSTMPELLKGSKPKAIFFGDERLPVNKWRAVYTEILTRCDAVYHDRLMGLRNKVHGRQRMILSDDPVGMDVPIKVCNGLYAEAYFDTGALLRMLTHILDITGYDYSQISFEVIWRRG